MFENDRRGPRRGAVSTTYARGFLAVVLAVAVVGTAAAQQYSTPEEAYRVGVSFLSLRQYPKARGPLEEGLKLAKDDPTKLRMYNALIVVYFYAGETDKVIEALDFILTKSPSDPERTMARRGMINYGQTQGKTDEIITRYEDRLKKDPNDIPALFVLSDVYSQLRPNPQRSGELVARLATVMKQSGGDQNTTPALAEQFVKAGKFKEGADMYEQIAERDTTTRAWHLKEAAMARLKSGDKGGALATARNADSGPPEARNDLLAHFWHRAMGDVYLQGGAPEEAVPHYELAIKKTNIDGYVKDTKKSLEQAEAMVERSGATVKRAPARGASTKAKPAAPAIASEFTTKPGSAPRTTAKAGKGGAVDLNRATLAQLQTVDGITDDLAVQIISRRKMAPFASVSELIELDGVDKALLAKIRPKLTVGAPK